MPSLTIPGSSTHATASPIDRGLTPSERDFILKTAGRNIDGTPFPLPLLERSRALHNVQYNDAVRQFGVNSGAARFERATVDCLTELIDRARFEDARQESLRERERRKAELRRKIADFKRPGSGVTLPQLGAAATELTAMERQIELAGMQEDMEVLDLRREVLALEGERLKNDLRRLIENFKRPGSGITAAQVGAAVPDLLRNSRQQELAGNKSDSEAWDLYLQVTDLLKTR